MYYPGDDNWWLGAIGSSGLQWSPVGNTGVFGHGINDGRPFWTRSFSRADRAEILFYYPGDDNWWLGTYDGSQLQWSLVGNTAGFGHAINDGRPFWIGDFNGDGRSDVLMYYPGDGNWWLGAIGSSGLQWVLAGNTLGAPQPPAPLPTQCQALSDELADLETTIADLQAELRTAAPPAKPALAAQIRSAQARARQIRRDLAACIARNSPPPPPPWPNLGQVWDGRPFWIGNLSQADRAQVLFYFPGDGNWWLGTYDGSRLGWTRVGNTLGANPLDPNFGQVWDGRPFWTGQFSGTALTEILFLFPGDQR